MVRVSISHQRNGSRSQHTSLMMLQLHSFEALFAAECYLKKNPSIDFLCHLYCLGLGEQEHVPVFFVTMAPFKRRITVIFKYLQIKM